MPIREYASGYTLPQTEEQQVRYCKVLAPDGIEYDVNIVDAALQQDVLVEDDKGQIYRRYEEGDVVKSEYLPILRRYQNGGIVAYRYDGINAKIFGKLAIIQTATPQEADSWFGEQGKIAMFIHGLDEGCTGKMVNTIVNAWPSSEHNVQHTDILAKFNPYINERSVETINGISIAPSRGTAETVGNVVGSILLVLLGAIACILLIKWLIVKYRLLKHRFDSEYDWLITFADGTSDVIRASKYVFKDNHVHFIDKRRNLIVMYPLGSYKSVQKQLDVDRKK